MIICPRCGREHLFITFNHDENGDGCCDTCGYSLKSGGWILESGHGRLVIGTMEEKE